jgi:hypothetical protein
MPVPIEDLREEHFMPKWYLNGFPKSGLHWLSLMMMPVAKPLDDGHEYHNTPWAGTFFHNSWSHEWMPTPRTTYKIGRLLDGTFLKGHCGYNTEIERYLWHLGVANVFIYRDLRDIAVSQAFHVLSEDDDKMAHPEKGLYKKLPDLESVLYEVICGVTSEETGVEYPGVLERWEHYAGWLDVDWTCKIRFEELKADTISVARKVLTHGLHRICGIFGLTPKVVVDNLDVVTGWMVSAGKMTAKSPTFRAGRIGDWKTHFTPGLKRTFKDLDTNGWLVRLGYEENNDW